MAAYVPDELLNGHVPDEFLNGPTTGTTGIAGMHVPNGDASYMTSHVDDVGVVFEEEIHEGPDDIETPDCKTPGSQFHITVKPKEIGGIVELPFEIKLNKDEANDLEDQIHDALEEILAPFFKKKAIGISDVPSSGISYANRLGLDSNDEQAHEKLVGGRDDIEQDDAWPDRERAREEHFSGNSEDGEDLSGFSFLGFGEKKMDKVLAELSDNLKRLGHSDRAEMVGEIRKVAREDVELGGNYEASSGDAKASSGDAFKPGDKVWVSYTDGETYKALVRGGPSYFNKYEVEWANKNWGPTGKKEWRYISSLKKDTGVGPSQNPQDHADGQAVKARWEGVFHPAVVMSFDPNTRKYLVKWDVGGKQNEIEEDEVLPNRDATEAPVKRTDPAATSTDAAAGDGTYTLDDPKYTYHISKDRKYTAIGKESGNTYGPFRLDQVKQNSVIAQNIDKINAWIKGEGEAPPTGEKAPAGKDSKESKAPEDFKAPKGFEVVQERDMEDYFDEGSNKTKQRKVNVNNRTVGYHPEDGQPMVMTRKDLAFSDGTIPTGFFIPLQARKEWDKLAEQNKNIPDDTLASIEALEAGFGSNLTKKELRALGYGRVGSRSAQGTREEWGQRRRVRKQQREAWKARRKALRGGESREERKKNRIERRRLRRQRKG